MDIAELVLIGYKDSPLMRNRNMWAIPALTTNEIGSIEEQLKIAGLWSILLFRRADKMVLRGLEQNWSMFNTALGENAHIITLLDIKRIDDKVSLSFPKNYEAKVGEFCNELGVRLDELPALVLLNGQSEQFKGTPYWSFHRASLKEGSDALVHLVSDMQEATRHPPYSARNMEEWLQHATDQLLRSTSGREARGVMLKNSGLIISALKKIFGHPYL